MSKYQSDKINWCDHENVQGTLKIYLQADNNNINIYINININTINNLFHFCNFFFSFFF